MHSSLRELQKQVAGEKDKHAIVPFPPSSGKNTDDHLQEMYCQILKLPGEFWGEEQGEQRGEKLYPGWKAACRGI